MYLWRNLLICALFITEVVTVKVSDEEDISQEETPDLTKEELDPLNNLDRQARISDSDQNDLAASLLTLSQMTEEDLAAFTKVQSLLEQLPADKNLKKSPTTTPATPSRSRLPPHQLLPKHTLSMSTLQKRHQNPYNTSPQLIQPTNSRVRIFSNVQGPSKPKTNQQWTTRKIKYATQHGKGTSGTSNGGIDPNDMSPKEISNFLQKLSGKEKEKVKTTKKPNNTKKKENNENVTNMSDSYHKTLLGDYKFPLQDFKGFGKIKSGFENDFLEAIYDKPISEIRNLTTSKTLSQPKVSNKFKGQNHQHFMQKEKEHNKDLQSLKDDLKLIKEGLLQLSNNNKKVTSKSETGHPAVNTEEESVQPSVFDDDSVIVASYPDLVKLLNQGEERPPKQPVRDLSRFGIQSSFTRPNQGLTQKDLVIYSRVQDLLEGSRPENNPIFVEDPFAISQGGIQVPYAAIQYVKQAPYHPTQSPYHSSYPSSQSYKQSLYPPSDSLKQGVYSIQQPSNVPQANFQSHRNSPNLQQTGQSEGLYNRQTSINFNKRPQIIPHVGNRPRFVLPPQDTFKQQRQPIFLNQRPQRKQISRPTMSSKPQVNYNQRNYNQLVFATQRPSNNQQLLSTQNKAFNIQYNENQNAFKTSTLVGPMPDINNQNTLSQYGPSQSFVEEETNKQSQNSFNVSYENENTNSDKSEGLSEGDLTAYLTVQALLKKITKKS